MDNNTKSIELEALDYVLYVAVFLATGFAWIWAISLLLKAVQVWLAG